MVKKLKKTQVWWKNLSPELKAEHMKKWERDDKPRMEVPELTQKEIRRINARMVEIGMEQYIVLREEGEILY